MEFVADPTEADLAILPPARLGEFAARRELAMLPEQFVQASHPLHWHSLLSAYSRNLSGWGDRLFALPVAGDGYVTVYLMNRFQDDRHQNGFRAKTGKSLNPPATWDDLAEIAEYFHEANGGKPSLPALPADPERLVAMFFRIAASADRKSTTLAAGQANASDSLSFLYDLTTSRPRLTQPAFVYAAEWLARINRCRLPEPSDDPVAALDAGGAVVAVLSLSELDRLPRDESGAVAKRFGVSRVPGSRVVFDKDGRREERAGVGNYIPYLGADSKVGVVFSSGTSQAAAWDFLAELASAPVSLAMLSDPALGVGPFRTEHLEETRSAQVWLRYGFDPSGTRALTDAMRQYLSLEVGNPTFVLRVPGQAELVGSLAKHLRRASLGEVTAMGALEATIRDWDSVAAENPERFEGWLRAAAGLQ